MTDQIMKASSELSAIVPELWSANFYPTLKEKLVWRECVGDMYGSEISGLGDTVNISTFPQFSDATVMLEDQKVDADSVTVTNTQLIINKQVAKDYIITKKAMKQSLEAQNALRDLALFSIMKKMDSIIVAEISPSASAPDHVIAYDSGTTLALADILEAKELLDLQDVEDDGMRKMVVGAAQANDVFNITGFVSRDFLPAGSPAPLASGGVNSPLVGFNFEWTTEVGNTSYFFHPMFLQLAVQQEPEVEVHKLGQDGSRGERVNMDVLFGVKQVSNLRVVSVS